MYEKIPLSELEHSPTNVRKVKPSDQGFKSLCASISSKGLLHNLVVTKSGSTYEVIDGNRRLDALRSVYSEQDPHIPCIVVDRNDQEVGLHANMMREDMHPLDECDVIMALCANGEEDFDSVASRFGQTERWVKQRVSLSELSENAKAMFRNGDFNMATAQALTLGTHEKQDAFLEANEHNLNASLAKRAMTSAKIPTSAALFDWESKRIELGVESDLFGDEEFITDIEAFEYLQNHYVMSVVDEYKTKGYYDVVYLLDQYYWDSPELRGYQRCHNEDDFDVSQLIMVVTYNSYKHQIDTYIMVHYETKEEEEAKTEEEEEKTPLDYSNPQRDLVHSYFADASVRKMWECQQDKTNESLDVAKFFKALLCHRKLGYGYHHIHRVGNVYADPQNIFLAGGEPDGHTDYDFNKHIEEHKVASNDAFDNDGTSPLMYCYTLPDEELDDLFVACCLQGLNRSDFQSEAMQDFNKIIDLQNWFKPDASWVNKWKINQIEDVERWLYSGPKGGNKQDRVNNIVESLSTGKLDPYVKHWPPQSEQS